MPGPDITFWQQRFEQQATPWDRGAPSPQLATWVPTLRALNGPIGVPGCGSGHEVAALAQAGCDVIGIDYAPAAIALARARLQSAGVNATLVQADVLQWQPAQRLAAVYEQTCLCALHPSDWVAYAAQLQRWLRPGGLLCALFVQMRRASADEGRIEGPPYHCDINAMQALFPHTQWQWPKAPHTRIAHAAGWFELALVLQRR